MKSELKEEKRVEQAALSIVVAGKHAYILESTTRILESAGYDVRGAVDLADVMELLTSQSSDVLFLSGGINPSDRQELLDYVRKEAKGMTVVEHFGGPATILSELAEALRSQAKG